MSSPTERATWPGCMTEALNIVQCSQTRRFVEACGTRRSVPRRVPPCPLHGDRHRRFGCARRHSGDHTRVGRSCGWSRWRHRLQEVSARCSRCWGCRFLRGKSAGRLILSSRWRRGWSLRPTTEGGGRRERSPRAGRVVANRPRPSNIGGNPHPPRLLRRRYSLRERRERTRVTRYSHRRLCQNRLS